MDNILISLNEVSSTAASLAKLNSSLAACFKRMQQCMAELDLSWESEASFVVKDKFGMLSVQFEKYIEVVNSYIQFLNETVEHYELTDLTLKRNAESFE